METASPPTIYVPAADVRTDLLIAAQGSTVCEWKGVATYFDVAVDGERSSRATWSYPELPAAYAALAEQFAFTPAASSAISMQSGCAPRPAVSTAAG